MDVYRGPVSKDLSDESHELVDCIDLSTDTESWIDDKIIFANITKDGYERQSRATIFLKDRDIIALHQGLIKGWQEQLDVMGKLRRDVSQRTNALEKIRDLVKLRIHSGTEAETFKSIFEIIDDALQEKKSE